MFSLFKKKPETKAELQNISHQLSLYKQMEKITNSGLWYIDLKTGQLTWSEGTYDLYDLNYEEVYNLKEIMDNYVHESDKAKIYMALNACIRNGTPLDVVHRLITPEKKIKTIKAKASAMYDEDKKIVGIVGVATLLDG